jgi:hypothetical protein
MPLINLQTNLKLLKYGHDRPDGGSSNQPYVATDITDPTIPLSVLVRNPVVREILGSTNAANLASFVDSRYDDGFIRGGIISATNDSIVDAFRISKFFTDASSPKGYLFLAKQTALQLTNPRLEVKKLGFNAQSAKQFLKAVLSPGQLVSGEALGELTGGLLAPTRVYNLGLNTLAQVPVTAFGIHLNRHGILPVQDDDSKYEAVATYNSNYDFNNPSTTTPIFNNTRGWRGYGNRLIRLSKKFELGDGDFEIHENRRSQIKQARRQNRQNKKAARPSKKIARKLRSQFIDQWNATNVTPFVGGYAVAPFGSAPSPYPSLSQFGYNFKKIKPDLSNSTIDNYLGGPDSVYGIGRTIIRRSTYTEDKYKYEQSLIYSTLNAGNPLINGERQDFFYTDLATGDGLIPRALGKGSGSISNYPGVYGIDDIITLTPVSPQFSSYEGLAGLLEVIRTPDSGSPNGTLVGMYDVARVSGSAIMGNSMYSTTQLGQISYTNAYGETYVVSQSTWNAASREKRVGSGRTDILNQTSIVSNIGIGKSINTITGSIYNKQGKNQDVNNLNDLCVFKVEAINGSSPSTANVMLFRAYLTDLSDNIDADWNDIKYAGRGDKFFIYNSFSRRISIGFKTAALSFDEMKPMYQKLNYLMSNLMPDYVGPLMRGPLVRVTVGNWIDSQPGILNSLSYKIPQESPWEISINKDESLQLPHIVEANFTFTPIGSQDGSTNHISQKSPNISNIAQQYSGNPKWI